MGNFRSELVLGCLEVVLGYLACVGNSCVEVALGYPGILFHYVTGSQLAVLEVAALEMPEQKQVVDCTCSLS